MLIEEALRQATDSQIKSEWARRTQAMRKSRGGGRKPKDDASTVMPRYVRKFPSVTEMVHKGIVDTLPRQDGHDAKSCRVYGCLMCRAQTIPGHHAKCACSICAEARS